MPLPLHGLVAHAEAAGPHVGHRKQAPPVLRPDGDVHRVEGETRKRGLELEEDHQGRDGSGRLADADGDGVDRGEPELQVVEHEMRAAGGVYGAHHARR